jgi:hypothetical protein
MFLEEIIYMKKVDPTLIANLPERILFAVSVIDFTIEFQGFRQRPGAFSLFEKSDYSMYEQANNQKQGALDSRPAESGAVMSHKTPHQSHNLFVSADEAIEHLSETKVAEVVHDIGKSTSQNDIDLFAGAQKLAAISASTIARDFTLQNRSTLYASEIEPQFALHEEFLASERHAYALLNSPHIPNVPNPKIKTLVGVLASLIRTAPLTPWKLGSAIEQSIVESLHTRAHRKAALEGKKEKYHGNH